MALWFTFSWPADYRCGDYFFRMLALMDGVILTRLCCFGVVPLDLRLRRLAFESYFLSGLSRFLPTYYLPFCEIFYSECEMTPLKSPSSILAKELIVDRFEVTPVKETSSNGWYGCWAIDYLCTLFGGYSPEKCYRPMLFKGCHTITDPAVSLVRRRGSFYPTIGFKKMLLSRNSFSKAST